MPTERRNKPARKAALEEPHRLMSIIESAMDAIITVDEGQRVVMFNRAAERIFGVPAAEAIGSELDRFIPQRFRAAHRRHVETFGRTGETTRAMGHLGTLSGLRADGTEFPIEASISQALADGRKYLTVILRDVSERHKLEAQLLQAQKMEGIGRLAGGVAHDFNNLLMAIFNYLALAARRLEPGHAAHAPLNQAKDAADRAAVLTRQLLTFARKEAVSRRIVSPRGVVAGLAPMLHRVLGDDIALRTDLAPDTGNVRADVSQLEQVLMNLAVNARDAMPRGGSITIGTRNVTLDDAHCRGRPDARPGEHVLISVADTGEGMGPEVLEHLFEPFFTTKPAGKGTGLGLATCHGIVRQSGGHMAVESRPGRGTTMTIYLPRISADTGAGPAPKAAPEPPTGTETILLVEDSAMVRDLTADALRDAGYTVLAADSASGALAAAAAHPGRIDLLVTDLVMPGLGGAQLAESLSRQRRGLRVIYMSGSEERAKQVPAHAFLVKPFLTDELLRKVRAVLDGAA